MTQLTVPVMAEGVGWHGKLPVVGDFVSRRLHSAFVDTWDDWLSRGIAGLRERDAGHWLEHYMASPVWRFVITPNFLPSPLHQGIWAGVITPSVDRVGRHYPLTLAAHLSAIPADRMEQGGLWTWLHQLEDVAVDAIQDDWSIDQLDAELLCLGLPQVATYSQGYKEGAGPWTPFFAACLEASQTSSGGRCIWYSGVGLQATRLLVSERLDDSVQGLWS